MRASAILSTLALATAAIAAPVKNGDIANSNPMDPEGDLAARGSVTVSADPKQLLAEAKASFAGLSKLAHGAGEKVPAKVDVNARALDLPTAEVLDVANSLTAAVPVVDDLPLPIRERALDLPTGDVTGLVSKLPVVGTVTNALPVDSVESVTDALPVDSVTNALPVDSVTNALPVDSVTNALPVDSVTNALPVDSLPLPIRRRADLSSLTSPLTSTLNLLVNKFSTALSSISSASTQLNSMLPANIDNADAVLDEVESTLATVQPQMNDAIDTIQKGDVQGLISTAATGGSGKSAAQLADLIASANKMLTQMSQDADAVAGLGVTSYVAKARSIQAQATSLLAQLQSATGLQSPVPL